MVGATVIISTLIVAPTEPFEFLANFLLDVKFKHANRIEADSRVVMIDINDYALEQISSWPWPRDLHADLVRTLNGLGARAVLMDIVFDSAERGRCDDPRLEPDARVDVPTKVLGTEVNIIWDDDKFRAALSETGNVYLGMFARTYQPQYFPGKVREAAYAVLDELASPTRTKFTRRLRAKLPHTDWVPSGTGRSTEQADRDELFAQIRIEHALTRDFSLDEEQLAERLNIELDQVLLKLATAKRSVARRLVRAFRTDRPAATFLETLAHVLPNLPADVTNPDRQDVLTAYRVITSELHILANAPEADKSIVGRVPNISNPTYPIDLFAESAHAGLVVFDTDAADGIMRRVPLIAYDRGRVIKHLGFAVACDMLDIDDASCRVERGNILAMEDRSGKRAWRVQLDADGRSLINWHTDPAEPKLWQKSFDHIPATLVMNLSENQREIEEAEARLIYAQMRYVEMAAGGVAAEINRFVKAANQRLAMTADGVDEGEREELAALELQLRETVERSVAAVTSWGDEIIDALGEDVKESDLMPDEALIYKLARAAPEFKKTTENTRRRVALLRREIETLTSQLKPRIAGSACLVGYTATAVADTVNTPVFDEVPGVMAHANVINSMFINQFPRTILPWRGWYRWLDVTLIIFAGMVMTVITVWRDPWFSLAAMLILVAIILGLTTTVFDIDSLHVDAAGPLTACFLSWAFVTLYRQLTEERQKRAFSQSLAQYTSPAIAAQLAENLTRQAGTLDLAPQSRLVTCFFSDLKGFTSISERLGASRTREVLNPYLEAMSDVLIRHEAMINKFMGDGIFAFFNPPILPVENHPRAACEAALDSFDALERLIEVLGHGELGEEVRGLRMRIGVNTGEVFVGDYGSSNKLDYTCIGDTVNLSARLEPACKPFGIEAMVSEATLTAAGEGFVTRHLGGLQVVGKKEAIQVYELIGRTGQVSADRVEHADRFGKAVTEFQGSKWEAALKTIAACRSMRANDLAADLLESNIRKHIANPPADDWNQAIELTSK